MNDSTDCRAVDLPFETGEYPTTWQVSDREHNILKIPGLLIVEKGKYPTGMLYGDMPIEYENGSASFPQCHRFDVLTGRLSSGAYVALMNGELSYVFPGSGRIVGAFAALSLEPFDTSEHRKYAAIELQIEGVESVAGVMPISGIKMPTKVGDEPTWQVSLAKDANFTWRAGNVSMEFCYNHRVRAFDGYEFRIAFGPVLRISSDQPLAIVGWWLEWVRPLRQLISLLTGEPREVRYLLAMVAGVAPRSRRDQVFGWDITHLPVNSTRAAVEAIRSAVNLSCDHLSLLDLLCSWKWRIKEGHPLFETYGSMVATADQHPRSRLLLLLQALEGSYGFENREEFAADNGKFGDKRNEVLERARQLLDKTDFKFVNKNLRREASRGLSQALSELLTRLPDVISEDLEGAELIKVVREADSDKNRLPVHDALTRVRNILSHGSGSFDPQHLEAAADILERAVRYEVLRLLDVPSEARERAVEEYE